MYETFKKETHHKNFTNLYNEVEINKDCVSFLKFSTVKLLNADNRFFKQRLEILINNVSRYNFYSANA